MGKNNMADVINFLENYRQQIFTIAKKFDDNPAYRMVKEERRLVSQLIPELGLQVDIDERSEVLKALGILELFTQPHALQALEQGRSIDEVYNIAVREFAVDYANLLLERQAQYDENP